MARPQKEGLDYFPLDLDIVQDDKLLVPIGKYGMMGFGLIIRLMMEIYKNGYFYRWGEKEQYVFANRINVDINLVNEVVNECVKWEFFHRNSLDTYGILTSNGFQKRYIEAAKRRKEITMIDDHVLADLQHLSNKHNITIVVVSADGKPVNVYKNEDKVNIAPTETPQSKVKERKVKEIEIKDKKTRHKTEYAEDSTPYKMALYFHQKIMEHAQESGVAHLVSKANLQSWADDCRKILEIDKVEKDLIRAVIDWATADSFWKTNVLSASKLREKFSDLAMKMRQEKIISNQGSKGTSGKHSIPIFQTTKSEPISEEEFEAMRERAHRLDEKFDK
jgi:hypothetical protein